MTPPILVAGLGDVFCGDDAFGVEVARRLLERPPAHAAVADFGTRGLELVFELLDGVEVLIAIDAVPRGLTPGTLSVVEPDVAALPLPPPGTQGMTLGSVVASVRAVGGKVPRVILICCEPERTGAGLVLSRAVEAAIVPAAALVREHLERAWQALETPARAGMLEAQGR